MLSDKGLANSFPPSPNFDRVAKSFEKRNNTDLFLYIVFYKQEHTTDYTTENDPLPLDHTATHHSFHYKLWWEKIIGILLHF